MKIAPITHAVKHILDSSCFGTVMREQTYQPAQCGDITLPKKQ